MSLWNHSICYTCWEAENPMRQAVAVTTAKAHVCCLCGKDHTSGIFLRRDPNSMKCLGKGPEHAEDGR